MEKLLLHSMCSGTSMKKSKPGGQPIKVLLCMLSADRAKTRMPVRYLVHVGETTTLASTYLFCNCSSVLTKPEYSLLLLLTSSRREDVQNEGDAELGLSDAASHMAFAMHKAAFIIALKRLWFSTCIIFPLPSLSPHACVAGFHNRIAMQCLSAEEPHCHVLQASRIGMEKPPTLRFTGVRQLLQPSPPCCIDLSGLSLLWVQTELC